MSSKNCSETFGFVPDVQSAEKLLREHELETTTSFVMYYNYGVGKGKSPVRGPGGGGMVLPIMAYTGRLRPKGVSFSGFRYIKG